MATKNQRGILRLEMSLMCDSILNQKNVLLKGQYPVLIKDIQEYTLEMDGNDLIVWLEKCELDKLIEEYNDNDRRVTYDYFERVKRLETELDNYLRQTENEINEEFYE